MPDRHTPTAAPPSAPPVTPAAARTGDQTATAPDVIAPGWPAMWRAFGRIGLMSFGGPAAQIAVMHRVLVDEARWLGERQFLSALSFCMLLPGPEAMQLATYSGWRLRGTAGGLLAGLLFVLPGAAVMLALAWAYALWGALPAAQWAFLGIKAAIVIVVLQALRNVARKALHAPAHWAIAGLSFLAIFALHAPFPAIIALAALWGALAPSAKAKPHSPAPHPAVGPPLATTLGRSALWAALWWAPVALTIALGQPGLTEIGLFFSKLAVVTFGGAYAVLAYMAQEVVTTHGWITPQTMIDGLGLAETTPGPLILVTEFVGFQAGFGMGGLATAVAAAALTLWVTFVPCFLWIFAGAPYIEALTSRPRLSGALTAITAAVVGVILNLTIWFAFHVFFTAVTPVALGPLDLSLPDPATIAPAALGLAALAALMLFALRLPLSLTLALMAGAGLALGAVV